MTEAQRKRALRRARIPWSEEVADPRDARGQRHGHHGLLALMALAFACGRTVLRRMEELSEDVGQKTRRALGLPKRVADTTLYRLLSQQSPAGLRETLQAMVKTWLEQKVVRNDLFPVGVMSVDGKSIWTSTRHVVDGARVSVGPDGTVASLSSLRAVLTSSSARPCVDLELMAAKQGESPAFRRMFPRLCEELGSSFLIVTADAGLTCRENARLVTAQGKHYLFGLKGNQQHLHSLAQRAFALCPGGLRARTEERRDGNTLVRELHTLSVYDAPAVDMEGAEQFWCVTQVTHPPQGEPTTEVRYFISSVPLGLLTPTQQLHLVRLHWGIENGHNWTMDVMLQEDDRQPCQATKDSIEVTTWLRLLGYNLLAVWRARAPRKDCLPLSWSRAMELLRDLLVAATPAELTPVLV